MSSRFEVHDTSGRKAQAAEWSVQLEGATPERVLAWASDMFGKRVALASSLGAEDQALIAMVAAGGIPMRVLTLDTGRLFPETYDLIAQTSSRYGLRIHVYWPDSAALERMVADHGINLFRSSVAGRKRCCGVRKLEPLARALEGLDAWVTGLRHEQSSERSGAGIVEWDDANGLFKVNPLVDWTNEDVWEYIHAHHVPYNPLHDAGFPSIGCAPCTRAVEPGADPRSGRWWWESGESRECGLHASGRTKGA